MALGQRRVRRAFDQWEEVMTVNDADEVDRLRAEVERLTAITKAQGQNVSWMSYHDACAGRDAATRRALRAEAALSRVRELPDQWEAMADAHEDTYPTEARVVRADAADLRAALDPASPATRPSPDPADRATVVIAMTKAATDLGWFPATAESSADHVSVTVESAPSPSHSERLAAIKDGS
jgi:hypothetical protein